MKSLKFNAHWQVRKMGNFTFQAQIYLNRKTMIEP